MIGAGGGLRLLLLLLNLMEGDFFSMNLSKCCGDRGGCGGDVGAFIVSVRGILLFGLQDSHICANCGCY